MADLSKLREMGERWINTKRIIGAGAETPAERQRCGFMLLAALDEIEREVAAQADAQPAVADVPEGWVMVPKVATDDMVVAFAEQWFSAIRCIDDPEMQDAYEAMLDAAPEPPISSAAGRPLIYGATSDDCVIVQRRDLRLALEAVGPGDLGLPWDSKAGLALLRIRALSAAPAAPQVCETCRGSGEVRLDAGGSFPCLDCEADGYVQRAAPAAPASEGVETLRAFARWSLEQVWEGCDIDGASAQDKAEELGLIEPYTVTEPCGENCACAEGADFPTTCYRYGPLLAAAKPGEVSRG